MFESLLGIGAWKQRMPAPDRALPGRAGRPERDRPHGQRQIGVAKLTSLMQAVRHEDRIPTA